LVVLVAIAAMAAAFSTPGAGAIPPGWLVSANPANWTPQVLGGRVNAIVQVGNRVVVGGTFSRVREAGHSTIHPRRNLFAFDAATGVIDRGFKPDPDGQVETLVTDGNALFVGGRFGLIGGQWAARLAKLDGRTGRQVTGFRVEADRTVTHLVLGSGRLFVAGEFTTLNGTGRTGLGAVDPTTGTLDPDVDLAFSQPFDSSLFVSRIALSPDGSRLVVIGSFTRVDGHWRPQLAVLDVGARPAKVADWHTERYGAKCSSRFPSYMRDVSISPDGSYFVAVTTGARSRPHLCDTAARFELSARGYSLEPTWVAYTGGDTLTRVAVTDAAVYIGGHPRWLNNPFNQNGTGKDATPGPGAVPRQGIAALDPANGLPLSWNPGRNPRGVGVFAFLPTPAGLWVGSDTDNIGGEKHPRLALLPVAGGTSIPSFVTGTLPGALFAVAPGASLSLVGQSFDGSGPGAAAALADGVDWSRARGAFMVNGKLYTGWDDGRFEARSFDGSTLGPPAAIDLRGLTSTHFPLSSVTGFFFDRGRLYYTVWGEGKLFYRYFTPQSGVVGAETFEARSSRSAVDWAEVRGLTLASGRLYYGSSDGSLQRIDFRDGAAVAGSDSPVSSGGRNWHSRGLFVLSR
jgi:hypothetical protein